MKIFRLHIIRYWSALLLIAGIFLHLGSSANEELRKDVFTQWLEWQLDHSEQGLKAELADLGYKDEELSDALRHASSLIQSGDQSSDEKDTSNPDHEIYRILIQQWHQFNDQDHGMGKAVSFEQQKPSAIQHNDGFLSSGNSPDHKDPRSGSSEIKGIVFSELPPAYTLLPMKGGTAIGAP